MTSLGEPAANRHFTESGAEDTAVTTSQLSVASGTQENSVFATALAAPPPPAQDPIQALLAIPTTVVNLAAGFVAAVLSTFLAPGPVGPAQPPLTLFAVLDWVRREIQRTFFNRSPNAVANVFTTSEDDDVSGNVLDNDTDDDGDPMTASLVSGPAHGDLTLNPDGSFTYTPDANYNGTDTFTYQVSDEASGWHLHGFFGFLGGGHTNTATVTVNVTAVNDAPVTTNDTATIAEDTHASGNVLANDTDVDSSPLTAALGTGPTNGVAVVNANGTYTYTPNANFHGTDTFTYTASDGTTAATGTVTVTVTSVEDAPVAVNDQLATNEDTPLHFTPGDLLENDSDGDGDTLVTFVQSPSHGSLTANSDGTYTYTPNADFHGTDTFSYVANDGTTSSNIATVTVTVSSVNDAPVAQPEAFSTAEDSPAFGDNVLSNDSDPDGDPLTAQLISGPANAASFTFNPDGSFTYAPGANFSGEDTFTYRASDGTATSGLTVVHVFVGPSNDDVVARDDTNATSANTPVNGNVLTNDVAQNPDGPSESLTVTTTGPITTTGGGTVTMASNGTYTYTPGTDFEGTDTFSYTVTDGLTSDVGQVSITVTEGTVNIPPVAQDDDYTTAANTPLTINGVDLLANDDDPDGDHANLNGTIVDQPNYGTLVGNGDGTFTYTPNTDFEGFDTFTYQITDGQDLSNIATVTITVGNPVINTPPVPGFDGLATNTDTPLTIHPADLLANDFDAEGDPLTVTVVETTTHGTLILNGDGSYTYTPTTGYTGQDSFTYAANDGTDDSNPALVTINIGIPANQPVITTDDELSTDVDTPLTINPQDLLANDTDPEGEDLNLYVVSAPAHGTLHFDIDGNIVYTPDAGFEGTDTFHYAAYDGTADTLATVTITVGNVVVPPPGSNAVPGYDSFGTPIDTNLTITDTQLLANDFDPDGDPITVVLDLPPDHGTIIDNGDGTYTYTPDTGYVGEDTFSYVLNDGTADSDLPGLVTIHIGGSANTAPVADPDFLDTATDTPLTITYTDLTGNDSDTDGPTTLVNYIVPGPTAHGTIIDNGDGTYTYTPNTGYQGTDTFHYTAFDGESDSTPTQVTITIGNAVQM
jgi:VCBS repeat-containing protein